MLSLKNWHEQRAEFEKAGVELPTFDVRAAKEAGAAQPKWIHIGAGNLFRTFHAEVAQRLLDAGLMDRGIVVADIRQGDTIENIWRPFNDDVLEVVMRPDGKLGKRVIASVASSLFAHPSCPADYEQMRRYFESPELQFVTVTITEKGYGLTDASGKLLPDVTEEMAASPDEPKTSMGIVAALLHARFVAGAAPIAMVTTDNFSQNGRRFRESVTTIARGWFEAGKVDAAFVDYVSDEGRVSFPWSMIDRITPNPSEDVRAKLADEGFGDINLIGTPGGTTFASFANTEEARYLVIEDSFPNGRPALDKGGVILTDRATAEKADTMKVTACLNPLHTCLAVYGCLLGYTRIWQEMEDADLVTLIRHLGYDEDLPVVVDPKVIDPQAFIAELLEKRLPNKALPDAPQRIASDTSQKVSIRYGHTLAAYAADPALDPSKLTYIPLVIAGWLRYLLGIDDNGDSFTPSPDPLLGELQKQLSSISLGSADEASVHAAVAPILSNKEIFTVDLFELGLGEKVEKMLLSELVGPGAVRATIRSYN